MQENKCFRREGRRRASNKGAGKQEDLDQARKGENVGRIRKAREKCGWQKNGHNRQSFS